MLLIQQFPFIIKLMYQGHFLNMKGFFYFIFHKVILKYSILLFFMFFLPKSNKIILVLLRIFRTLSSFPIPASTNYY